jgi:UDP-N-acetylglucosamine 2-epimerase (non-hydrolysing)
MFKKATATSKMQQVNCTQSVMVVIGTRPEIIKMAPIVRVLQERKTPFIFTHCGQHYDYSMSQQFIEQLELPTPDYSYEVKAYSQGIQTARILIHIERLLKKTRPFLVLVEGDTNGVLATALATVKLGTPLGHVEAGLRSFDLRMPEEHNRRLTDHVSTYLFAPTKTAENNLKKENVWGKVYVTGNTIIDAVLQHLPIAKRKSTILETVKFKQFALATAHRAENTDDIDFLKNLIETFDEAPLPVVYPMHPRTKKRLKQNHLYDKIAKSNNLQILPPLGYLDFLVLMEKCKLILTDSGGIQEEATSPNIRKPVLVMRLSTERPEAVGAGFAKIVGVKKHDILAAMKGILNKERELPTETPYGDGHSAEKIVDIIEKEMSI